jgi:hypothetical protein
MEASEVRRAVDAAGRATGYMLAAEDQLQTAMDILRAAESAHEELPEAMRSYFRLLAHKSRQDRIRVIEYGEYLAARYGREQ